MTSPYTNTFSTPSTFYEWNGTSLSTFPNPANASNDASYVGHLLVLPTGQIMFTDFTTGVAILTTTGTYQSAWQPTITTAPSTLTAGQTYSISGTQFNGVSQGAAYGDDFQDATNYPLVRIVNNATGHVFYARTHGHSTMGVATGSTAVSTNFDVPANVESGPCELYVAANGIPSSGSSCIVGSSQPSTTVVASSANPSTYGQTLTLTATVTGSGGTPTGTVQFTANSTVISGCSAVALSSGAAHCTASGFSVGTQAIVATYSGDSNFTGSSGSLSQVVNQASVNVSVASGLNPSAYGQSVAFTATISGANGQVKGRSGRNGVRPMTVTGNVTWSSNTGCGTTSVSAGNPGTAACTTSTLSAGTDTITATYNGDTNHSTGTGTLGGGEVVNQANQTITFTTNAPASAVYNSQFTVAAAGGASGNPVVFSSAGSCANSGATYTMTSGTGSCSVIANQAGNANYAAAAQVTETTSATKANQAITFTTNAPASAAYGAQFTVAATGGGSGNPVVFSSAGACTNSGATYTMTSSTGTCSVIADQAGNTNYTAATEVTESTSATSGGAGVSVASSLNPSVYGQSVTFTATISGQFGLVRNRKNGARPMDVTGTVTWSSNTGCGTTAVTSGSPGIATCTTSILAVGTADTVTANYSGDGNHNSGSGAASQEVDAAGASVNIASSLNPSTYGQSVTFTATISGANGLVKGRHPGSSSAKPMDISGTVTWSSNTGCSTAPVTAGNPGTATCTTSSLGGGTDAVTASYSGDANHSGGTGTLSGGQVVDQASQTIAFATNAPASAAAGSQFTVAATGGASGNAVVFTSGGSCTNSGATYTMTSGTGTCTVIANQAGNANYAAATQVTETVAASTAGSIVAVASSTNPSVYGQAVSFIATVTGASPTGTVQFYVDGGAFGSPLTLSGGAAASGTISTLTAGTHTVTATYSGDTNDQGGTGTLAGGQVVTTAGAGVSVASGLNPSVYGQSVTFTATISGANGLVKGRRNGAKPMDVTGSVTWSSNTGCGTTIVIAGNPGTATCTTAALGAGSYTVTANYSGDANHNSETGSVSQTVNQASQTITFTTNAPASVAYGAQFTVAATGGASGNAVVFTSTGSCTNSGATYSMTSGTGICSVIANQAGNDNYTAAAQVSETVTATPASQTITVTTPAPASALDNSSFTVVASASSGLPITFGSSGACTNSGATYTITATSGTCMVTMNQAGNANYSAAPTVSEMTTALKTIPPTVSFTGAPASAVYGATFTVTATSNSPSTPTITAAPATVCTISGTLVTMVKGMGTCTLTAKWAASGVYSAATATQTTAAAKAISVITWATPGPIVYGTPLSATQLNATANVAGKFVYTPASGKVLAAGTQTLSAAFTPTATTNYTTAAATVQLVVNQAATTTITGTSLNPSLVNKAVKISFTVAPGKPTGSVTVNASNGQSCTGALTGGKGSCSITFSSTGSITLMATYPGDSNNQGSVSAGFTQKVN